MKAMNELIRGLREDNDLKQADVCEKLGIAQQTYSNYETGAYELPTRHLATLAAFYHVSTDYLLGLTEYQGTNDELQSLLTSEITAGALLSDILALDADGKRAVVAYVDLLKLKRNNG